MRVKASSFLTNRKAATNKLANKVIKKAISHKSGNTSQSIASQQFSCPKCDGKFLSRWFLLKHKCIPPIADNEQKLACVDDLTLNLLCSLCNAKFSNENDMKLHRIMHSGNKPHTCHPCNTTFENYEKWKSHLTESINQSHCDECLQSFGCVLTKQNHICIDTNFICTNCDASFKKQIQLDRHQVTCLLKKECSDCGKKFVRPGALEKHKELYCGMLERSDQENVDVDIKTERGAVENSGGIPIFQEFDNFLKQGNGKQDSSTVKFKNQTVRLNGPVSSLVLCSMIRASKRDEARTSTYRKSQCEICHRVFKNVRAKKAHRRIHFFQETKEPSMPVLEPKIPLNKNIKLRSRCDTCNKLTCFEKQDLPPQCEKCGENCTCMEITTEVAPDVDKSVPSNDTVVVSDDMNENTTEETTKISISPETIAASPKPDEVTEEKVDDVVASDVPEPTDIEIDISIPTKEVTTENEIINKEEEEDDKTQPIKMADSPVENVTSLKFVCVECKTQTKEGINDDFFCGRCLEIFDDEGIYNEHMDGHNITECSDSFEDEMVRKRSSMPNLDPCTSCYDCNCSFKSYRGLRLHQYHHHPEIKRKNDAEQISCLKCEKVLSSALSFEFHQKTCYNTAAATAAINAENSELKRLQTTLRENNVHHAPGIPGNTECSKCLKVFRSPKLLELHEKQMHKEIKCHLCGALFWRIEDLRSHSRIHVNKQFKCEFCKTVVSSSMALRFHRMEHFGSLVRDIRRKGIPTSMYVCHHCKMPFETFRKFEIHCKKLTIEYDAKLGAVVVKMPPREFTTRRETKLPEFSAVEFVNENISEGNTETEKISYLNDTKPSSSSSPPPSSSSSSTSRVFRESDASFNQENDMRCNLGSILQKSPETNSRTEADHNTATTSSKGNIDFTSTLPGDNGPEMLPDDEDPLQAVKEIPEWLGPVVDEQSADLFIRTSITAIENQEKVSPITVTQKNSKMVNLAIKAMECSLFSKECKRVSPVVKRLIKRVFATLVRDRVSANKPHKCIICSKVFIKPQGITNHYFRRHGSRGIMRSLRIMYKRNLPPSELETRRWGRRIKREDKTALAERIGGGAGAGARARGGAGAGARGGAGAGARGGGGEGRGQEVTYRKVEDNVSPKDEPRLIELRNNFSSLMCHLVGDTEVLAELGWPQRLIDDVLVDVIVKCESKPCLDARKSRLSRLRENITTLLSICVKEQAMENFGWYDKPVDEVVKEMLAGGEIGNN